MRLSPLEQRISNIITPIADDAGFTLVHVVMTSEDNTAILRVMIEQAETGELNIDDCARLSRAIGAALDVEDVIAGAYRLEVSSPGVDRPLVKAADFTTWAGFEIKAEIEPPLPTGQKRFRGVLRGLAGDNVLLDTDEGPFELPLHDILKARLVLTDELLAFGQEKRAARLQRAQEQAQAEQAQAEAEQEQNEPEQADQDQTHKQQNQA